MVRLPALITARALVLMGPSAIRLEFSTKHGYGLAMNLALTGARIRFPARQDVITAPAVQFIAIVIPEEVARHRNAHCK